MSSFYCLRLKQNEGYNLLLWFEWKQMNMEYESDKHGKCQLKESLNRAKKIKKLSIIQLFENSRKISHSVFSFNGIRGFQILAKGMWYCRMWGYFEQISSVGQIHHHRYCIKM